MPFASRLSERHTRPQHGRRAKSQLRTPGAPMGMADIAEVLWNDFLQHNPSNQNGPIVTASSCPTVHGSMLIYSLLHLSVMTCRSKTETVPSTALTNPGSPEYGYTAGVETTTGPLDKASPMPSVLPWRNAPWRASSTVRATTSSTTTPTCSW